jgi:hypothetical protein
MESRQEGISQTKRINNSIRAAAICIGVSPETVLMHIDFLRAADELLKQSKSHLNEAEKLSKDVKKATV